LNKELLKDFLPPPYAKTNADYCTYCLTYRQKVEEDPHVENTDIPDF